MQNPKPKIRLVYDNEDYDIDMEAYDKNLDILLPDGRVLAVQGWLESYPPQPRGVKELDPFTLERTITTEAQIAPKDVVFEYKNKEYCASSRMLSSKYVVLPDFTVLDIVRLSYSPPTFDFLEVRQNMHIDIKEEAQKGVVIKAQLKSLTKENKVDFTKDTSSKTGYVFNNDPETQSINNSIAQVSKTPEVAKQEQPAVVYFTEFDNESRVQSKISFMFEKEDYQVGMDAYDKNQDIRLPDGRVVSVHGWLESMPPQPMGIKLVDNPNYNNTIQAEFLPKDFVFQFEGQEYCTTYKIFSSPYVMLPGGTTLKTTLVDYETKAFTFEEVQIGTIKEMDNKKLIKADYNSPTISFTYENEDYEISKTSYVSDYIKLPDGRVLKAEMWLESNPPQPAGLHVVEVADSFPVGFANFEPKDVKFSYEDKEYATTTRMNSTQYIQLPDNTILQKVFHDPYNKDQPYYFIETLVDVNAEVEQGNLIKADRINPVKKLKM